MSILPFLSAFALTIVTTPLAAKFMLNRGIVGVDLHKDGGIKVPEMGGITIFFSLLVILVYHYIIGFDDLLFPIIGIWIIGTLGVADGLTRLSASQKVISFTVVGVFLAWGLGFRGAVIYLLIGFLFMASVNFTNMLAGFNGLEIGTGAIAALGLTMVSFLSGSQTSFILSSTAAGALLAFLYFNRYPSKVFPGDVGTLIIGAALFPAILLGELYVAGFLIFLPYILDAGLKFLSAGVMTRESQKPTEFRDGKLYVPGGTNSSLSRFFLKKRAMSEKEVVFRVWSVELLSSSLAIFYVVIG
jgi:UDP-N-acetylglucosamine--dolichyl-phosphate N-acetylglucosaminephosphotransferase